MASFERNEILFVGTSNSLRTEDYTVPLKETYKQYANYSLGASAYTLLALQAERIRCHRGATVVIDLAVTDLYIADTIYVDADLHRRAFEALLADCARCEHRPHILLMPSNWSRAYDGPVRALYHQYAREYGVPIFDGFNFVERLYDIRPDLARYGYESGTHLHEYLARMLGRSLDTAIERMAANDRVSVTVAGHSWQGHDFQPVGIADDPRSIVYENSLGTRRLIRLRPGESVEFSIPSNHEVVGYAVNAMASWGHLQIEGDRSITKDLRNGWAKEGNRLILTAWTFAKSLRSRQGIVQVSCLHPDRIGSVVEPNEIPFRGKIPPSIQHVELCALLTLAPRFGAARMVVKGPLDLLALVTDAEIDAVSRVEQEPEFVPTPEAVRVGADGVAVTIPHGHSYREGRDGRIVVLPPGTKARQDASGRVIVLTPYDIQREADERARVRIEAEQRRAEHRKQIETTTIRRQEIEAERANQRAEHRSRVEQSKKARQTEILRREQHKRAQLEHAARIAAQREKNASLRSLAPDQTTKTKMDQVAVVRSPGNENA